MCLSYVNVGIEKRKKNRKFYKILPGDYFLTLGFQIFNFEVVFAGGIVFVLWFQGFVIKSFNLQVDFPEAYPVEVFIIFRIGPFGKHQFCKKRFNSIIIVTVFSYVFFILFLLENLGWNVYGQSVSHRLSGR